LNLSNIHPTPICVSAISNLLSASFPKSRLVCKGRKSQTL